MDKPQKKFIQGLQHFLHASSSPAQAVANMVEQLLAAGFQSLNGNAPTTLQAGQGYFITQGNTSIVALRMGQQPVTQTGVRLIAAHTDSPCLKVKPQPELSNKNYWQLGVEVYGGALLHTWFDRDLSLAGQVHYLDADQQLRTSLIDFRRPIAIIPSLAIHLNREANSKSSVNAQQHLPPLIGLAAGLGKSFNLREGLQQELARKGIKATQVVDYDLCFYPVEEPRLTGLAEEFISSARLDNLLSCYTGLQALLAAPAEATAILVCNDHEEVGSASNIGAESPFLARTLRQLVTTDAEFQLMLSRSLVVSCDNAHALHPNFDDKHDANHGPLINAGPVIKTNANQRYATTGFTSALFSQFCQAAGVPVQHFVVRSDMACGSTIGPIAATQLGIQVVDVGAAQWAMHSARETAGTHDAWYLNLALQEFIQTANLGFS